MNTNGFTAAGFEPVREAFEANFVEGFEHGAAFAAYLGDELVVDLRGGFADRTSEIPWTSDTLCPVYSATKPIGALVIATLVERGKLDYDAPVADYWPEFAANGKGAYTVAEALSHQTGIPGFPDQIDPGLWLDPPALAAALADLKPMWAGARGPGITRSPGVISRASLFVVYPDAHSERSCAKTSASRLASISGSVCLRANMAGSLSFSNRKPRRSSPTTTPKPALHS